MYTDAFLDHFRCPRGQGGLGGFSTHCGTAEDGACGDRLWLDLRVEDGRVAEASFRVQGCAGAIAAGSALVTLLPGRPARADGVRREEIEQVLGEVPRAKRHALSLAVRVLAAAIASGPGRQEGREGAPESTG